MTALGLVVSLLVCLIGCGVAGAAEPAVVFDARSLTWDERCAAEALQGLVNRDGPRLFLSDGGAYDRRWLDVYAERAGLRYERVPDFASLLRRFAPAVKGAVVYDPAVDGSRYVAVTMAGVEGLLPVSPAILAGETPSLRVGSEWPGIDFTQSYLALNEWRTANLAPLAAGTAGMRTELGEKAPGWGFTSYGPFTIDVGRYPLLDAEVGDVGEGARWFLKLTWDRNGDGVLGGSADDLALSPEAGEKARRWDIAALGGVSGRHTFASVQLHVAGPAAAGAVWKRVRFVSREGAAPPAGRALALSDLGIRVKEDLRGRFKGSVAAYEWALEKLMPRCSRRLAHSVNGGTVDGILTGVCGPMSGFDWQVQNRGFVFNLGSWAKKETSYGAQVGGSPEHAATYRRILSALTPPAMVNGYGDPEGEWCTLLSKHGHYSFHAYTNWSFHAKVPASGKPIRQKVAFTPANTRPETERTYVCFMTSEGDTMKGPLPFFYGSWMDPARGKVPVNWGINPLMAGHFPAMLEYFYDTATDNDYFFTGCSGAGYCYPDSMKDLDAFLRHTRDLCRLADLPCIDLWGASSWETLRRYEEVTRPLAITSNSGPARMGFAGHGTPVLFHELAYWQTHGLDGANWGTVFADDAKRADAVQRLVGRIESIAARTKPPFVILVYGDLHSYSRHASLYQEVAQALDPKRFKPARLDEAMAGIRAWAANRVVVGSPNVNEPLRWAALVGVPTQVPVRLTNCRDRAVDVEVRTSVGGSPATLKARLQPWETKELGDAALSPEREGTLKASLQVRYGRVSEEYPAELTAVPAPGVRAGQARLEALWSSRQLSHESGQAIEAADAAGGAAWSSPPAGAKPACIVYGPYATVAKGRYAVAFRLRLSAEAAAAAPATPVATIDVFAGGYQGSAKRHARRDLTRGDFTAPGGWQWFTLEAEWAGPPDLMETRVYWHGKAEVAIDQVAVFELSGRTPR